MNNSNAEHPNTKSIEFERLSAFVMQDGSYGVGKGLQALRGRVRWQMWWRLLGEWWPSMDDGPDVLEFMRLVLRFSGPRHRAVAMTDGERKALAALPARVEVWRGCYEHNRDGLSWTLSEDIARKFASGAYALYHHAGLEPLLLHGWAERDKSILKLDRQEHEIVTHCVNDVTTVPLQQCAA